MPKINQEEYEILKGLDDKWKWIARDSNQQLYAFDCPPNKSTPKGNWTNNWNAPYLLPHDWLQFIKWEDKEPYNIAELIEEYEEESEEIEVKDIEWLKKILFDESVIMLFPNDIEKLHELIEQLDEPEVLSREWIDENEEMVILMNKGYDDLGNAYSAGTMVKGVPSRKLQNLLVTKQEKIKVPDWFAEWCKGRVWGDGFHEGKAFTRSDVRALVQIADGEDLHGLTQEQADEIYGDFFKYLDAFFYGYEVEEEQKYIISINITDKDSKTNYETFLNKRGIFHSMENDSFNSEEFNWSEEEIRGLTKGDILFEHFAVKVEELEE